MSKSSGQRKTAHRSSVSGRFVRESYANANPRTTQKEVNRTSKGKRK